MITFLSYKYDNIFVVSKLESLSIPNKNECTLILIKLLGKQLNLKIFINSNICSHRQLMILAQNR